MIWQTLLGILLAVLALFLILLVLVQRGRGGGLAGALGGSGGQSAFGTKAGDTFTRITIVTAAAWILLCILSIKMMGSNTNKFNTTGGGNNLPSSTAPDTTTVDPDESTMPPATDATPSTTGAAPPAIDPTPPASDTTSGGEAPAASEE